MDWQEQYVGHRSDMSLKPHLIDSYIEKMSVTPEDVLLEKERIESISELIDIIKQQLTNKEFDILWSSIIDGETHDSIAARYDISRVAITQQLKRTYSKCQKIILSLPNGDDYKELLQDRESILTAGAPESRGYPHEFLQEVNIGGEFKTSKSGRRKYISCEQCQLPEYFQACFGDKETKCTLCTNEFDENTCSRKKDN